MSKNAQFSQGEGIHQPNPTLALFLLDYAISKGVPIYEDSRLNRRPLDSDVNITWSSKDDLQNNTPKLEITVQEFLQRCDNYVNRMAASRVIALGDDTDVVLDGATQIMTMRREAIKFADIRKVLELTKAYGGDSAASFRDNEGITGPPALMEYLVNYAKGKGVKFATDHRHNILDAEGNYNTRRTRMRWHSSSSDNINGLLCHTYDTELTVQQFLSKCDNYVDVTQFTVPLTRSYSALVNHADQQVAVGCQRISFERVGTLVKEMEEVTAMAAAKAN